MHTSFSAILAVGLLMLFLTGCTPSHVIILVPDPDGHVGEAEISTSAGTMLLDQPLQMTRVSGPSRPPSPVTTAEPGYIAATFGEALAIQPPPKAEPPPPQIPPPPEKFILFFEKGTIELVPESRAAIAAIAAACTQRTAVSVTISGHADASGSHQLNEKLAEERSLLVRDLLRLNGVNPGIMQVTSHGKRAPLVPTPDGIAEQRNRRVEIIVR